MVPWTVMVLLGVSILVVTGCRRDREMADRVEMPDTTTLMRAMESEAARDAMLDTLPGGEMARGDSAMEMELLKDKM